MFFNLEEISTARSLGTSLSGFVISGCKSTWMKLFASEGALQLLNYFSYYFTERIKDNPAIENPWPILYTPCPYMQIQFLEYLCLFYTSYSHSLNDVFQRFA